MNCIGHSIYRNDIPGDREACPAPAKDRNGDITLAVCRHCGAGESELEVDCVDRYLVDIFVGAAPQDFRPDPVFGHVQRIDPFACYYGYDAYRVKFADLRCLYFPNGGPRNHGGLALVRRQSSVAGPSDFAIGSTIWPGLGKLVEETGELLQVLGKLIGSHGNPDHWSGNLLEMLTEELGDLDAAQKFFIRFNTSIDPRAVATRSLLKQTRFEGWHNNPERTK